MKKIKLKQGKYTTVDNNNFSELSKYKWRLNQKGYVIRDVWKNRKSCIIFMHRFILATPTGMQTDHKDGNKLNNQKTNLRICNNSENQRNCGLKSNNKSGFKGVWWSKEMKKWRAQIRINGNSYHLGYFFDKKQAAKVYNQAAIKYFGQFYKLNNV